MAARSFGGSSFIAEAAPEVQYLRAFLSTTTANRHVD
jgi:hypothetical protein